ncbi:MAG: TetR/AcrR family transcriptional regulator [Hellea sp.]|nr:TetR/AcrR family transcriptional regulator [Hellea sp.]
MAKTKTRRERVEDREIAIIQAARGIFNDKGFGKTTMAGIARAAGVADGTVYLYFKNKEDLARAVLADFYGKLTETAQIGVDKREGARTKLKFLARHHMTNVMADWRVLEMLPLIDMQMDRYEGSELYKLNRAYVAVFDRVAKNAAGQGLVAPDTPLWVLRDMFFGAMDYSARTMMFVRQDDNINGFVDHLMGLLFSGASGGPSREEAVLARFESLADRLEQKL